MSALHPMTDGNAVDTKEMTLEELVTLVIPHLSHMVNFPPKKQEILDTKDKRQQAICLPLTKRYVITTQGLAYRRRWFLFSRPQLMGRVHILSIDEPTRQAIRESLQNLLKNDNRSFAGKA